MTLIDGPGYLLNQTSYNGTSCYGTTASFLNSILIAGGIVADGLKEAGVTKSVNSEISKQAQVTVGSFAAKSAAARSKFDTKYREFGVSIDQTGTPSKTFAQIKSELTTQAEALKKSVDKTKQDAVSQYNSLKTTVDNWKADIVSYDAITDSLKNMETTNAGKIKVDGGKATAIAPNASDYEKYLSEADKNAGKTGKDTQAYTDALAERENLATQYNQEVANQKAILVKNSVSSKEELATKIEKAEPKLADLAKGEINDSSGMTVADYTSQLDVINTKLAKLGTEEDFNAAVAEVKNLYDDYSKALEITTQEARVAEQDNLVKSSKADLKKAKRNNKTGFKGWWYDITHKDKKDKEVVRLKGVYNDAKTEADKRKLALQNGYEKYYPKE